MNELIAFILGVFFKAMAAAIAGKAVTWFLMQVKDWPTLLHYLEEHGGKSFGCIECRLGHVNKVDSIG
jgi:hypothetical protein